MTSAQRLLTAEEFAQRPHRETDEREELVDGQVVVTPAPLFDHGWYARAVRRVLEAFADEHELGIVLENVGFLVAAEPDCVRAPDVAVVRREDLPPPDARHEYRDTPPLLAVEVVSSSASAADTNRRVQQYIGAGSRRVWTVWPETRTVTVHRPDGTARTYGERETLDSDAAGFEAEGLALPVADIFA